MESLFRDLRYATRSLRRAPAFTVASIITLALGSGAAVAVFAIVNAVLLRPLPYRDPSRVVLIWARPPDGSRTWLSLPEVEDLARDARMLSGVAGLMDLRLNLTGTVQEGLLVTTVGLAAGLGLMPLAAGALSAALYGVAPTDPVAYISAAVVLSAAAAVACVLPARRASRADPMVVLRNE